MKHNPRKSHKIPRKTSEKTPSEAHGNKSTLRINRYLARCGICSRREADRWIEEGRVAINGKLISEHGVKVGPGDRVTVDGQPVHIQSRHTYLLYNKPRGLLCSRNDAKGRPLIYEQLDVPPSVQSIGRLDMDTEGLLLLTDDGDLAYRLTQPSTRLPREYRARVAGHLSLETLQKLRSGGIDIGDGEKSAPWEVSIDAESSGHTWLTLVIRRGRWREVRRTLEAVGHPVRRLIRTRFGPIRLDENMSPGSWRPLTHSEIKKLRQQ